LGATTSSFCTAVKNQVRAKLSAKLGQKLG
jgi:uncharacterized small protein (DUF1192 family)